MQITFTARAPYVDVFEFISHRRQQQTESSAGLYKTIVLLQIYLNCSKYIFSSLNGISGTLVSLCSYIFMDAG